MTTWRASGQTPAERDPRRVSETLDRLTKRLGAPSSSVLSAVFSGWEALVGADIAAHSRPVSVHSGVLVLAVDHPAWATQLRFMTAELLTRLHEATGVGDVQEIQIRVTGEPPSSARRRGRS